MQVIISGQDLENVALCSSNWECGCDDDCSCDDRCGSVHLHHRHSNKQDYIEQKRIHV